MSLPISILTLLALFALAVRCAAHGGAMLFGGVLLVTLAGWLALRAGRRVAHSARRVHPSSRGAHRWSTR